MVIARLGLCSLLLTGAGACTAGQRRAACPETISFGLSGAQAFAGNQGTALGGSVVLTYRLKPAPVAKVADLPPPLPPR